MPVKGRSFGQERPPLTDVLKNILLRYPDGGQILKEIIQNADDAGASEVKFLFNDQSYGKTSLISSQLARFQGPALYCYNNAEFTEGDWKGLQRLMRSNKKDNPLKVGRFGIGFNSVYHITDLPSIVSGETVAFLDPHETFFVRGEPGQAFSMKDALLTENRDQFEPFHQILDCCVDQGDYFKGTLFRFPLRIEPSELSAKIYTKSMVMSLFGSLQDEARVILLFLKNVESIALYERDATGAVSHLYTVNLSNRCKADVRSKRKELTQNVTSDCQFSSRSVFYTLEVEDRLEGKNLRKRSWFIASQVGTEKEELINLGEELKLLPWIDIAFPVDTNTETDFRRGRIFCFLPLPPDADCRTGLPVHVNGYFGLTDNRRSLKWPGPDCQNDNTAQWNHCLLRIVGSKVYASLIENIISSAQLSALDARARAQLVYSAIPLTSDVKESWQCLINPFFSKILSKDIFFTAVHGRAGFVNLKEAIVDRLDQKGETNEQRNKAVRNALLKAGKPVVTVPRNVLKMIDDYSLTSGCRDIQEITPQLLRDVLRVQDQNESNTFSVTPEEKLLLLGYTLHDMPQSVTDFHNVPLLPLENGEFGVFKKFVPSSSSPKKVFIGSEKHNVRLLPHVKDRLIRDSISQSLKAKLVQLAICSFSVRSTQLFNLAREDVPDLLWQNFPHEWSLTNQPREKSVLWCPDMPRHPCAAWFSLVWEWIVDQYPSSLSLFQDMPLIPFCVGSGKFVGRLRYRSSIIVAQHWSYREGIPLELHEFLSSSGCPVVEKLPSYVKHEQIFDYVAPPSPEGLLRILMTEREAIISRLLDSKTEVKVHVRSILSKLTNVSDKEIAFIRALPIFGALNGSRFLPCVSNDKILPVAPQNFFLPDGIRIFDLSMIISSSDEESYLLLKKLGMKIESMASLLERRIQWYLRCGDYSEQEKNRLMSWILEKMEILVSEAPSFIQFLRQLAFVPTSSGSRRSPRQMYDHSDDVLCQLFQDDPNAFPVKEFFEPMRKRKKDLQVRDRNNLTAQDLLHVWNIGQSSPENDLRKGKALLDLVNQKPSLLSSTSGGVSLSHELSKIAWLPRVPCPPEKYPNFMPWYTGSHVCKPRDMCPSSLASLVGATVPIYDELLVKKEVQGAFGILTNHNLAQVTKQLQIAIESWNGRLIEPSKMEIVKFQALLKEIYRFLSRQTSQIVQQILKETRLYDWLWFGNGFCSPHKMAVFSRFPSHLNLYPYLFLLPTEFRFIKDFLVSIGVKEEFTDLDLLSVLESIKARHDSAKQKPDDVIKDLDFCRVILEWIVREDESLSENMWHNLLIPVQTCDGRLRLEPCETCTYCDREFLRRGGSEMDVTSDFHLIHEAIPDNLASLLGVPRLSSCLAQAEPLGYEIEEAGQHEPLTTRLRNILQEYKDGVAIFKELIQNADDAGASKVCFVVDWRENLGERLLCSDMAKCQGPALWAYNNAVFSKQDFENINKLAGGTKKDALDKIGRFGLGFNAVYHITDVPSFISAENFVVFDPNMNHIVGVTGKRSRAGLKINLAKSEHVLSFFPDQFIPYHMFGCDTRKVKSGKFKFEGTLFRFPLRTAEQAKQSQICHDPYTADDLSRVLESLKQSSSTLLLFAQNVKYVEVFEIHHGSDPTNALAEPILSISKELVKIVYSSYSDRVGKDTFLQHCCMWWRHRASNPWPKSSEEKREGPRRTELLKIHVSAAKSKITKVTASEKQQDTWLVNSCSGSSASLKVAESDKGRKHGLLPASGAAVKLSFGYRERESGHRAAIHCVGGEVFSFLPLSFSSGLPVHVNGYFSVLSNRRGIWEEGLGECDALKPFEARWNTALMQDALALAYLQLLEEVRSYADKHYLFHSLWPDPSKITHALAWKPFINAFFSRIIDESKPLFYCNKKWQPLQSCFILDPKLSKIPECLQVMNILGVPVLSVPEYLVQGFKCSGKAAIIADRTLTEDKFLRDYFFPNIAILPAEQRNSVICYVLDLRLRQRHNYDDLLRRYRSFSCSEEEKILRKPNELVHPRGQAACLFSEEEKVFPTEERFLTKERAMMLEDLGMLIDRLSWDQLCERAEWISCRATKEQQRAGRLINYMGQFLEKSPSEPSDEQKIRLRTAKFLPIMDKPKGYPLPWKGSSFPKNVLVAACDLYLENLKDLVGARRPILLESSRSFLIPKMKDILGLFSKEAQLEDVLFQLDSVIDFLKESGVKKAIEASCCAIYNHFMKIATEKKYSSQRSSLHNELCRRPWILVKGRMINPKRAAFKWDKEDGSPYLYALPEVYKTRYLGLIKWYGVKENFTADDFLQAIWKLREDTNGRKLSKQQLMVLVNFLHEVCNIPGLNLNDLGKPLPLPRKDCVLLNSTELAINDAPLIECDDSVQYVHDSIPLKLALQCGAKPLRTAVLNSCSDPIGQPFGQHELLTDRLKGILKSYPADEGILKELVQNADDAKASEIHFIFDPRTHGSERVFSDEWKELQGPAICVYNDQTFSQADIKGIQDLGIGSKVNDAEKTGQYGIGFNAVYHLTDCPSFLSDDQVLCISDPHCHYVAGASVLHPGRLFNQLDEKFRRNFKDVMGSFLDEFFTLKGGTMFRFPLRRFDAMKSDISQKCYNEKQARELLKMFEYTAKYMLLFLNSVKKISVSEVKNGKLESYSVSSTISVDGGEKRKDFSQNIRKYKRTPTDEIPWHVIHYSISVTDSRNVGQEWLVSQSLGYRNYPSEDFPIPDGAKMGLLPRAGIAALQPMSASSSQVSSARCRVFCFLPLPVTTSLPVHVNGHFALDSARRDLWHDTKISDERSQWNEFVKRQVLAPTYASFIVEARAHISGNENHPCGAVSSFASEQDAEVGLKWYHELFPSVGNTADRWTTVGASLYQYLSDDALPVLPIAQSVPQRKLRDPLQFLRFESLVKARTVAENVLVDWCTVENGLFSCDDDEKLHSLEKVLLEIGLPLLSHSPSKIYTGYQLSGRGKIVSPAEITKFLRLPCPWKNELPKSVKSTPLLSCQNVRVMLSYCSREEAFFKTLEGIPLLLTQDEMLRCFSAHDTVYCSKFNGLLPSKPELFLQASLESLFQPNLKKCTDIVEEFDVLHLSHFKNAVFPADMKNCEVHHPWNPSAQTDCVPSKEWLELLWRFIHHLSSDRKEDDILQSIETWPIIPTTQNCLVPVSLSKTVLNTSNFLTSDSNMDRSRRELLVKLNCPQLQNSLMPHQLDFRQNTGGSKAVLKYYLASIQSPEDVLNVLDYTLNRSSCESVVTLADQEILALLMFLQTDKSTLSVSLLQMLPFYETIEGNYTRLPNSRVFYEIPSGVPQNDFDILFDVAKCMFLKEAPMLRPLYKYIGIRQASSVEFYLSIVLKYFNHLTPVGRQSHLKYIRDSVLPCLFEEQPDCKPFICALKALPFIPDSSGTLHCASKFYDAKNKVFSAFVPKSLFPPAPYDTKDWRGFLAKVGLQTVVTKKHFEEYAMSVAREAANPKREQRSDISSMSQTLVSYLFKTSSLREDDAFLQSISTIKFVCAAEIGKEYLDIHPSHIAQSQNSESNCIAFQGSVVAQYAPIVWSSASLLSVDATPTGENKSELVKKLGIRTKPTIEVVLSHAINISQRFRETKEKEIPTALRYTFSRVMEQLYAHFKECCPRSTSSHAKCSHECATVCDTLRDVSIMLINERILVPASRLAFHGLHKSIEPFMFNVPRSLVYYEHFLKRLGAQEYPTPRQYSTVLQTIKSSCEDEKMHPGECKTARNAVKGLFHCLLKAKKSLEVLGTKKWDEEQSLSMVQILYLPTEDQYLNASTKLLVNDTMEPKDRLKEHWENLLVDFTVEEETADKLVELLPSHLEVRKLSATVADELDPTCIEKVCILENPSNEESCEFIQRYRRLLCSSEFSNALLRLFKFQEERSQVSASIQKSLRAMETCLHVCCMQAIKTRLVSVATGAVLSGSEKEVGCFYREDGGRFEIFVKHGEGEKDSGILHNRLSQFIHKITGRYVKEAQWRNLMTLLGAKLPIDLSKILDELRVPRSVDDGWKEPTPGEIIPDHFHYLLNSDIDYYLREGELVGYEMVEENAETDPVYVYAKIIEQSNEDEGRFGFGSRYRIDVGKEEPIEVGKTRLYKFDRSGTRAKQKKESSQTCKDIIQYEGAASQSAEAENEDKTPPRTPTLEEAKKEVAEALKEIWKLPQSERPGAIRRLIRRWHPDKNPECVSLANEAMKFLQNEVERLKKGGVPGYRAQESQPSKKPTGSGSRPEHQYTWDDFSEFFNAFGRRARRNRDRYRDWQHEGHEASDEAEPPNKNEADRWMRQAREDHNAAQFLFDSHNEAFYAFTCFHCHEATEKCLKAFLFAKGRIERADLEKHEVMSLAYRVAGEDRSLRCVPLLVQHLRNYYTGTRYPDYSRYSTDQRIPCDKFTRQNAALALSESGEILDLVEQRLVEI